MVRETALVISALLLLSGCASVAAGNEVGGVVPGNGVTMATKAKFDAAQVECGKYGKVASVRKISAWDGTMTYDCVAKDAAKP